MLTLFTIPKAFSGATGTAQDNAIGSWTRLGDGCEVILFGDDPGVAEAAARHAVRHVPDMARNAAGTPLVSDLFARADALARHPVLCFVNADIVLFPDILAAARAARGEFLLVSSRYDCRIDAALAFGPDWARDLRARVLREARMYPAGGSDLFLFPRGLFGTVPPFAIGRGYWDNWLMFEARRRGAQLIDATAAVVALHQQHTYEHLASAPARELDFLEPAPGEMADNLALAGGHGRLYTVYDATAVMTGDGSVAPTLRPALIGRRAKAWLRRRIAAAVPGVLRRLRDRRARR
jgi:hypothetical protein